MNREEAIKELQESHDMMRSYDIDSSESRLMTALNMAIKALEQEPKTRKFAEWVAREIFDDMWEYNKDAFAEIACRKLAKLGIVRAKGDEWELVEPERSDKE